MFKDQFGIAGSHVHKTTTCHGRFAGNSFGNKVTHNCQRYRDRAVGRILWVFRDNDKPVSELMCEKSVRVPRVNGRISIQIAHRVSGDNGSASPLVNLKEDLSLTALLNLIESTRAHRVVL